MQNFVQQIPFLDSPFEIFLTKEKEAILIDCPLLHERIIFLST